MRYRNVLIENRKEYAKIMGDGLVASHIHLIGPEGKGDHITPLSYFFSTLLHLIYQQVLSPADLFSSTSTAIVPTTILTPACQILQWLPVSLGVTLNSLPWSISPTGSSHCPFLCLSLVISYLPQFSQSVCPAYTST